jgi:hypothetical protein
MTAAVMLLLGAGVGAGVLVTWRTVSPRPIPLDTVLTQLSRPGTPVGSDAPDATSAVDRAGIVASRITRALGHDPSRLERHLELVGRTGERHAFDKLLAAIAGLLVPNMAAAGLAMFGLALPLGAVGVLSLATAAAGFVLPDFVLRTRRSDAAGPSATRCRPTST